MRRTGGPTAPPPAKTPGDPRVGVTGVIGETGQMAEASEAAGSFSAEGQQKREPDCCPPTEPNRNHKIENEAIQQEAWNTPKGRQYNFIPEYPCKPWVSPFLSWPCSRRCLQGLSKDFPHFFFFFGHLDYQDCYPEMTKKCYRIILQWKNTREWAVLRVWSAIVHAS